MSSTVIIALITGSFSLLGTFIGILTSAKLTTYRIEQLEKKVDALSDITVAVSKVSEKVAVINEAVKALHSRVEKIEGKEYRK